MPTNNPAVDGVLAHLVAKMQANRDDLVNTLVNGQRDYDKQRTLLREFQATVQAIDTVTQHHPMLDPMVPTNGGNGGGTGTSKPGVTVNLDQIEEALSGQPAADQDNGYGQTRTASRRAA